MLSMGKKKTALEAAMAGKAATINLERIGMSTGFALLLIVAGLCVFQASMVWIENQAEANLFAARDQAATRIGALVQRDQNAVQKALSTPELKAALMTELAAPAAMDTAVVGAVDRFHDSAAILGQHLPLLNLVTFYPAELAELVDADLVKFGYAKADILAEARETRAPARAQAQACAITEGDCLALAQPVLAGDQVLAYAYVLLPIDGILAELGQAPLGGSIELRQGSAKGSDWTLKRIGESSGEDGSLADNIQPITASHFQLSARRMTLFKPGLIFSALDTRSLGGLATVAVLSLLAAVVLMYRRLFPHGFIGKPKPQAEEEIFLPGLASASSGRSGKILDFGANSGIAVQELEAGADAGAAQPAQTVMAGAIDRSIFRAYDIRGVVGKTLTPTVTMLIGQAIGSMARARGLTQVCVARDGRLSGPKLCEALIAGLRASGCDVIDVGMVPTPVLYFATFHLGTGSGVMLTGSHNPPDYNGMKVVLGGETLAEESIQEIFARIVEGNLTHGMGGVQSVNVQDDYLDRIVSDVQTNRRLKVVVDAGNGVAGSIAPRVLEGIGCEVETLFCEIDGNFPNHHPDPSDPNNLTELKLAVKQLDADLGIAFDGDGDRLGVVTRNGEIIYPDRLLMLFAQDVLSRTPGAAVIYDVKCTGQLSEVIVRAGGSPLMWKTGHSLIKAKMREEDAALAGEMSGHFFFAERWYGFDDGIYAAARLLEILALRDETADQVFDELPKGVSTPELKIEMAEGEHYAFMERFRERAKFPGARVTTIDGIRADYKDGWGLVRCSNTTPCLVLRFDAVNKNALERIEAAYREQLLAVDPQLKLPF